MIREGQVVLFKFPYTDQIEGKLRPALVIRKVVGLRKSAYQLKEKMSNERNRNLSKIRQKYFITIAKSCNPNNNEAISYRTIAEGPEWPCSVNGLQTLPVMPRG